MDREEKRRGGQREERDERRGGEGKREINLFVFSFFYLFSKLIFCFNLVIVTCTPRKFCDNFIAA